MDTATQTRALDRLEEALEAQIREHPTRSFRYQVPSLWQSEGGTAMSVSVDPFSYYLEAVRAAKEAGPAPSGKPSAGEWTKNAVIYNMFVRTTTAFDHNANGVLDLPLNADGLRETGTFLKAIAMLPYIKRLGANTVHLLPITSIGHDGNKGSLGSPYAIRNPYEIDENLAEPVLGLDAKVEFQAFVEAAHRMGMRVVVEFVFRTAAKDADWVKEHPEWMYWIKEAVQVRDPEHQDESRYGSPLFTKEELEKIHHDVKGNKLDDLLPPHKVYREFFTAPPPAASVRKETGRYLGRLADGTRVKIPGAFADWPPDDNQPPWGDVTYLRMYTHPDFNYIGYNTIRMYDTRLTKTEHVNRPLWEKIVGIIPYYQKEFHIDGVMIDMGHALPMALKAEMVASARGNDPDFAFWDENFSVTAKSRDEGYNAVFGYLWVDEHHADRMKAFLVRLASEGFPIPFFATPENHNTPRAASREGGTLYAKWAFVVNSFLPAVPFIHSGYELSERYPINTGLDFTPEQIRQLPSEKLPLFSEYAYDWLSKEEFTSFVRKVLTLRAQYAPVVTDPAPSSFQAFETSSADVLAYARASADRSVRILIAGNANFTSRAACAIRLEMPDAPLQDLIGGGVFRISGGVLSANLEPGQCLVFQF